MGGLYVAHREFCFRLTLRRRAREFADVGEAVDAFNGVAQPPRARGAQHRRHQALELGLERPPLFGDIGPWDAGIVCRLEPRAVVELDRPFQPASAPSRALTRSTFFRAGS